ncbi:hypothetical protein ACGF3G_00715 [Streptomyces sp. NPDC048179]|uniref:hypothetical protein n=1 Tax=Streptomyces sp. NPDC048179 TaxID=3365506 RepID=UPI00371356F1
MPRTTTPTLDQMQNLIERAERKGGLTVDEGDRLRAGIERLIVNPAESLEVVELRRRNFNLTRSVSYWKRKAGSLADAITPTAVIAPAPEPEPTPTPELPPAPEPATVPAATPNAVDTDAREALRRVIGLAHRWTYIPSKRRAAQSILTVIRNKDE